MATPAQAGGERHATDGQVPSDRVPAVASLFAKIAEVMAEVGFVEKRGRNDFHKYEYATEVDVLTAVRSKLAERKVALIPALLSIEERPYTTTKGKESVITTATLGFTFVDGETGETLETRWAGQGDDPADKGLYKAYTGAVKYFLMKTFLIPTGDDPEADGRADQRGAGRQQPAEPPAPPLTDEKAKKLRADAEAEFEALAELDPAAVPRQRFDAWMAGVAHSHADMERLVEFLRGRKAEVEGAAV